MHLPPSIEEITALARFPYVDTQHEWDLIRRCRSGSTSAFEPLVLKHQDQGLRVATALLGDSDEAMDAVQDAFVKAYRTLDRLKEGSSFGPWFRSILRNGCLDRLRSPRRRKAVLSEEELVEPADASAEVEREELSANIRRALDALSPEHREILVLKEIEELSYAEMAQAIGIPEGTVASRVYHARLALKKVLLRRGITTEEIG